jgi:imidazolonepropionase-like amidohydrolase
MQNKHSFATSIQFFLVLLLSIVSSSIAHTQQTFPISAPSDERSEVYALTNATVYTDYKTKLEGSTLLIKKGIVEQVGEKVVIPSEAIVVDCSGKTIYPGFIDLYAGNYGLENTAAPSGRRDGPPQTTSNKKGAYAWNEALKPEYAAADYFSPDTKLGEEYRKLGFTAVVTHQPDGISRGSGALVSLDETSAHLSIINSNAGHFLSFRKGSSRQNYPSSLMGIIALLRQTYHDARWYQIAGKKEEYNASLEAWNTLQTLPQFFEATDKLDILRIRQIGKEFNIPYIVKTAGDEYQRLEEIKATNQPLIVSLNFPNGYDLRDPYALENISLRELKHWELAPSNPARLESAGITFALTTADLKDKSKFYAQLKKALENGLSEETALKALTFQPAQLLGAYDKIGSLEKGKSANFIIASGNIFDPETKIFQTWCKGNAYKYKDFNEVFPTQLLGSYQLTTSDSSSFNLVVGLKKGAADAYFLLPDSSKTKVNFQLQRDQLQLSWMQDTLAKTTALLSGTLPSLKGILSASGRGIWANGQPFTWKLQQSEQTPNPAKKTTPSKKITYGDIYYPFTGLGSTSKPVQKSYLIKNTTVWTNEKDGILKNTDVLVEYGKIKKIGQKLSVSQNVIQIDGTDKHLTAGIIDEHSHIAASRSINEGTQESSAEVRLSDVIDSEDPDIYRQLAGGVTASHILHGSANPIGGQTQLIKLRWGYAPEELKFNDWPGFIKFALGENVKQSNWGDNARFRYPQSRMGVEQVYMDYFTRAKEYLQLKKSGKPYRVDLDLETLGEILEQKRFITCHSYVQSEITMMMRVAEKFGFQLNTFTHILEGYKVADKMAKHGAGGSAFADWWAYKMEVYEAIPYNAAMMHQQGVLVAINSDDAEMARRLNQEAAKTVQYGGVNEEEALKMVTLNPAKLLHVDDKVGSIKPGKDADLVLWNTHPLSIYSKAQTTWIDGAIYFDQQEDEQRRVTLQQEKARLVQKMISEGKGGAGGDRPMPSKRHYHCDSMEDEGN